MDNLRQFIKSYWNYYIELEAQIIETKRFVEFDESNYKTFSVEYLKLYQAVCSEIDVVGKEIASAINQEFKIDRYTNIQKWGYEIQQYFNNIDKTTVLFDDELQIIPFLNWKYEINISKNGKQNYKVFDDKKTIQWWKDYNKVKHQRIGLVSGTKNFPLANQKNLIQSLAALFILEISYINSCSDDISIESSKLFKLQ